jgi:ADP-ribose pyrophosphatase YjhB (NUDIX family)
MGKLDPPSDSSGGYRDEAGRRLEDYPRPSVAVDTAVLTVEVDRRGDQRLAVLLVRRDGGHADGVWALPGTFLHPGERLAGAVDRSLRDKAGIDGLAPRQLHVFDDPARDERGWVLSIAHLAVAPYGWLAEAAAQSRVRLASAARPGSLPYDHREIVRRAVDELRRRYADAPDPDGLLPGAFTLRELRRVHEAVAGHELQRDTFRRAMQDRLVPTGGVSSSGPGRPAALFRRRG